MTHHHHTNAGTETGMEVVSASDATRQAIHVDLGDTSGLAPVEIQAKIERLQALASQTEEAGVPVGQPELKAEISGHLNNLHQMLVSAGQIEYVRNAGEGALFYPALFGRQDGSAEYVITFRDVPEAITQGSDVDGASMAEDALLSAMTFYVEDSKSMPPPSKDLQEGERWVHLVGGFLTEDGLIAIDEAKVTEWRLKPENVLAMQEIENALALDGQDANDAAFNELTTGNPTTAPSADQIGALSPLVLEEVAAAPELEQMSAEMEAQLLSGKPTNNGPVEMVKFRGQMIPKTFRKQMQKQVEEMERNSFKPGSLISQMRDPNKLY